jgi:hypothetical protein
MKTLVCIYARLQPNFLNREQKYSYYEKTLQKTWNTFSDQYTCILRSASNNNSFQFNSIFIYVQT